MVTVSYVYPNVSGVTQRGSLLERWNLATILGCEYIEVPADFIKNKTEVNKTHLNLGDFLTKEAISAIYAKDVDIPQKLKYILHTEPSLSRDDGMRRSSRAELKWHDKEWVDRFVSAVISISDFFEKPAEIIEVHPGYKKNSFEDIIASIGFLLDRYDEEFKVKSLVLVENRTGQFISNGKNILDFWNFLSDKHHNLKRRVGIVLDIQQLYTVTKNNFFKELDTIPLEAIKGYHIHYKHRAPNLSNEIPWKQVFEKIVSMKNHVIINPEIHHKAKVRDAIDFCRDMLTFK